MCDTHEIFDNATIDAYCIGLETQHPQDEVLFDITPHAEHHCGTSYNGGYSFESEDGLWDERPGLYGTKFAYAEDEAGEPYVPCPSCGAKVVFAQRTSC